MMISRRHLADRNYRNYGCHDDRRRHDNRGCLDDRVSNCPGFLDPIDDGVRLVRRPPRKTTEKETAVAVGQNAMEASPLLHHRDIVDVAKKKKRSGILKLPPSQIESKRKMYDLPPHGGGQPLHMNSSRELARWNTGRNLRWSEEDMERTGISGAEGQGGGGGGLGAEAEDDFQEDLSHLADLKEQVRRSVQNRKGQKLDSEAEDDDDDESTSTNGKPPPKPEVQSCPDIRFVVDEPQEHDGNHVPVRRLLGSLEEEEVAVQGHRLHQPPDAMSPPQGHRSRTKCHHHACSTAVFRSCSEGESYSRRVRTRSLDHYEHIPYDHRHMPPPHSRPRSRTSRIGVDRGETVPSAADGGSGSPDWDASGSNRSRSRARPTGGERVRLASAGPYDRRGTGSVCRSCGCCAAMGVESPDGRRERRLMQERCDARVWQELRGLLLAVPATATSTTPTTMMTTTCRRHQSRCQASKSSSSDETLYGGQMNHGKSRAGSEGGRGETPGSVRDCGSAVRDKMTQTEDFCRNFRGGLPRPWRKTPSIDRMYYNRNHRRSSIGENSERRSVDNGSQATASASASASADRDELDVHNCDSSITEVTSIWPSISGSGGTQDSGAAATTASTTDATTISCQSQESLALLQSISAELLGSSVSSECLRAAIDATTGGQPLDENSVIDAIDREMADVNQFVRETLDVSEIKPKEYLQMHMRNLQKFTTNLEEFITQQQKLSTGSSSSSLYPYGSPDSPWLQKNVAAIRKS